jgi:hypothetical protein
MSDVSNMSFVDRRKAELKEKHRKANMMIEVKLFPLIKKSFPQAKLNIGQFSSNIQIQFEGKYSHMGVTIYREENRHYGRSYNYALRMSYNSSFSRSAEVAFNKSFGGSRLKTDIIDPKFDMNKIVKLVKDCEEFYNEQTKVREFENEYKNQYDNKLNEANEEFFGGKGIVDRYDHTVTSQNIKVWVPGGNSQEVSINTGVISRELAKKVLDILGARI